MGDKIIDGDITGEGFGNYTENPTQINIKTLDYGYLVNIGQETMAFETIESLITSLNSYLIKNNCQKTCID